MIFTGLGLEVQRLARAGALASKGAVSNTVWAQPHTAAGQH